MAKLFIDITSKKKRLQRGKTLNAWPLCSINVLSSVSHYRLLPSNVHCYVLPLFYHGPTHFIYSLISYNIKWKWRQKCHMSLYTSQILYSCFILLLRFLERHSKSLSKCSKDVGEFQFTKYLKWILISLCDTFWRFMRRQLKIIDHLCSIYILSSILEWEI